MISKEDKVLVGGNCPSYSARNPIFMASMTEIGQSCSNCRYCSNEGCGKGLFQDIVEKLKNN